MSRSLGHKALHKKVQKQGGLDAEGRKMFADGLPCPPEWNDARGKDHARAKGWRRAAAEAKLHIERQGAAVISHAVIVYQSDAVVLIDLSMNTKRTAVGCLMEVDGVPGLSITTHEGSVHLHPIETGWTDITLPDWHGWDIFSAMGGKWAVRIALYHPERAQAQQKGPA